MLLLLEGIDGLWVRDTEDGAGQGHGGSCPSSTHGASCLCLFVIVCRCVRGNCERVRKVTKEKERKKRGKEEKKEGRWGLKRIREQREGRKEESAEMKSVRCTVLF